MLEELARESCVPTGGHASACRRSFFVPIAFWAGVDAWGAAERRRLGRRGRVVDCWG